jgi:hypothetical protein
MAKSACSKCEVTFSSVSAFDRHLRWRDGGLAHIDPAEIPELRLREDGVWAGMPLDAITIARKRDNSAAGVKG